MVEELKCRRCGGAITRMPGAEGSYAHMGRRFPPCTAENLSPGPAPLPDPELEAFLATEGRHAYEPTDYSALHVA